MSIRSQLRALLAVCLMAGVLCADGFAQGPIVSVGFRNDLKMPVIVQGTSKVNNMVRRGSPILVPAGRMSGDFNVPPGQRVYSVYDANQPTRVLAQNVPVNVVPGRNLSFVIRAVGNQVALVPE